MERGALLVIEGCDRVGKSTQVKRLVQALNDRNIKTESRGFPDRSTLIGSIINDFLTYKKDLPRETIHLLFSANRWECSDNIVKALNSGITLVIDRYAASGAAYSATSTKRPLSWCKTPDVGLPAPDLVALLTINYKSLESRSGWADERFENNEFQQQVADNFLKLKEDTWKIFSGDNSVEQIHEVLLKESLKVIDQVKNAPLKKLYDKQ